MSNYRVIDGEQWEEQPDGTWGPTPYQLRVNESRKADEMKRQDAERKRQEMEAWEREIARLKLQIKKVESLERTCDYLFWLVIFLAALFLISKF